MILRGTRLEIGRGLLAVDGPPWEERTPLAQVVRPFPRAPPRLPAGLRVLTADVYPTVTQAMYFGGGFATGPFPFPLGWYWAGALVAGLLLTAAWYRWRDRRTGSRTPLRGYLVTGLVLAMVTAALPLPAAQSSIRAAQTWQVMPRQSGGSEIMSYAPVSSVTGPSWPPWIRVVTPRPAGQSP